MPSQPDHASVSPRSQAARQATFTFGPLRVALALSPQGRVVSKRETVAGRSQEWAYAYDDQGRLARAVLNGKTVEEYGYGPRGERVFDALSALGMARRELHYDRSGQLLLAGRTRFRHDRGRLAVMETPRGGTHLVYGDNGGLEAAHLANGLVLEYVTDGLGRPVEKSIGGRVVERFHWLDDMRLGAWEDLAGGRVVKFVFGQGRVPRAARLEHSGGTVDLVLGADQVGTVKAIATADGHLIQHITYDSFGNVLDLQGEDLGLPVGFAGGVRDRHLGLVRFGHRDYDPAIGRFTAPDPLGAPAVGESSSLTDGDSRDDTGGDHDPWEYCVDDPVNAVDPEGLAPKQQGDEKESGNIFTDIGKWLTGLFGDDETAEDMSQRTDNVHENFDEATDGLNTAGSGGETELIERIRQAGLKDNWDAMRENANDTVESLGPNLFKLPSKATPRHRP